MWWGLGFWSVWEDESVEEARGRNGTADMDIDIDMALEFGW